MANLPSIGAMSLLGMLLAGPVLAQQTPADKPATTDQQAATPTLTTPEQPAPAIKQESPAASPGSAAIEQPPATIRGTLSTNDPRLVVATVTMKNGWRASKLIGSAVYNDQNQKIGSVDDLILTRDDDKVAMAVISVGGFLGMGSKLVAVPYDQLRLELTKDNEQRVHLPGGTKDALNAMPTFTYSST
jgi:sporulation protein YlmC with PRC-barrel domain